MSNYFGQLPPQFNNRYINNGIVNGYQQFMNTNTPFVNNPMLMNNPLFYGSIRDSDFYNRVNMAKMEQIKKIKNVNDLNMTTEQLSGYVICPIKVERMDKKQYDQLLGERESTYITHSKNKKENIPKVIKEWYDGRKNTPYKNILKNENYTKEFKKKEDLIVHKISQLDKDKIRLANEYETLARLLEKHDGELKVIYSASEETRHAEKFNYVNKYKNRIKYDPKNYDELKQFYKKTQKKIKKENKRIDEMIELLLVSDQISKEDMKEIQKSSEYIDDGNDVDMDVVFEKGEMKLEKQLEKELKKELGKDVYNQIMKEFETNDEPDPEPEPKSKVKISKVKFTRVKEQDEDEKPRVKTSKVKITHEEDQEPIKTEKPKVGVNKTSVEKEAPKSKVKVSRQDDVEDEPKKKPRVKVTKISDNERSENKQKTKEKSSSIPIGHVTDDELDKYRNRR